MSVYVLNAQIVHYIIIILGDIVANVSFNSLDKATGPLLPCIIYINVYHNKKK